jgi:hypothetical protein
MRRKYGRKTTRRRPKKTTHHISPMAHLARKVQGLDTRVHGLEAEVGKIPKRFVRRKHKPHRLGTLEEHYSEGGLGSGE